MGEEDGDKKLSVIKVEAGSNAHRLLYEMLVWKNWSFGMELRGSLRPTRQQASEKYVRVYI